MSRSGKGSSGKRGFRNGVNVRKKRQREQGRAKATDAADSGLAGMAKGTTDAHDKTEGVWLDEAPDRMAPTADERIHLRVWASGIGSGDPMRRIATIALAEQEQSDRLGKAVQEISAQRDAALARLSCGNCKGSL